MSDEYKIVQIRDADGRLEWQMTPTSVGVASGPGDDVTVLVLQHGAKNEKHNSLRVLRRTSTGAWIAEWILDGGV